MPNDPEQTGGRTDLREQILSYLEQHPQSMDTLEGIAQWWRARSKTRVDLDALSSIVEALANDNRLQVIESGSTRLFRLADVHKVRYGSSDFDGLTAALKQEPAGRSTLVLLTGDPAEARIAASAVARGLQRSLDRVDLSAVVSQYIGETEKNLGRVFSQASQSGSVLFLENGDALFGRRTDAQSAADRDVAREVTCLLEHIDGFAGTVALSVKNPDSARPIARRLRRARSVLVL